MCTLVHMSGNKPQNSIYANNLRRLMAKSGLTISQTAIATAVCEHTIKLILQGRNKPHSRTLNRLATGLGVSTDEFFCPLPIGESDSGADEAIRNKVDRLLMTEHRRLLTGFINVLHEQACKQSDGSQAYPRVHLS